MAAQERQHLGRITLDDLDMHLRDTVALSFFDNLDGVPLRLRLFTPWWSPAALIGWKLPARIEERRAIVAFAIGRHRRRRLRMPAVFELRHQVVRNLLLTLTNRRPYAEATIHIECYAAPEGAALVGFGIAAFSPLLPT